MLENVFFVSMEGRRDFKIGDFQVREDVPLPVFCAEGKNFSSEDITPDNIILGMFRVIKENPESEHLNYYREFIYNVKQDIDAQLTSAAFEAENNGDYSDAIDIYQGLLILNPNSLDHLLNIAICYDEYSIHLFAKGKEGEALHMEELAYQYFKAIDAVPEKTDRAYYYLGRFYFARENYEKAMEYFKEFVRETKDSERKAEVLKALESVQNLGVLNEDYRYAEELVESDKDEAAIEYVDKFIASFPLSWNGYYLKGYIYRKLGEYNKAIENFEHSLKLNGSQADLYNELGLCHMNLENYNQAELHYSKALRNSPDDMSIYYNLAVLSYKRGNFKEALKYCEVILEFDKGNLKTRELMEIIKNDQS